MASNLYTFAPAEIRMRYREPFLTEALNRKLAAITPRGIYRGFRLAGTMVNGQLQIVPDALTSDHVAVFETSSAYSVTVRKTGALLLDLSAHAGTVVVVTIRGSYAVGSETVFTLRAYTVTEYNGASELPELVVLGTVTVPSGAPITTIVYDRRTLASRNAAPGAIPTDTLLRNGSFEFGPALSTAPVELGWQKAVTVGTAVWRTTSAVAAPGSLKSLELNVTSGPVTGTVLQPLGCPARPGAILRLSYALRVVDPTTGGSVTIGYSFLDAAGAAAGSVSITVPTGSSTGGSFVTYEVTRAVPAGVTHVRALVITATGATFATGGSVLYIDDVALDLYDRQTDHEPGNQGGAVRILGAAGLLLEDPTTTAAYASGTLIRHLASAFGGSPGAVVSGRDGSANLLNLLGRLIVGAGLSASPLLSRLRSDVATGAYTLIYEAQGGTAGITRLYVAASGDLFFTRNALWDGTNWTRDVASAVNTTGLYIGSGGLTMYDHDTALADTWNDSLATTGHWEMVFEAFGPVAGTPVLRGRDRIDAGRTLRGGLTTPDSNAGAAVARLSTGRSATPVRSLIHDLPGGSMGVRIYRSVSGSVESWELTINALWDPAAATWSRDVAGGQDSVKFAYSNAGLDIRRSNVATWADNAWTTDSLRLSAVPSPAPTSAPNVNSLHAAQVARSWAVIDTDGAGGATIVEGFNIATASLLSGVLLVTFARVMADENYVVHPTLVVPGAPGATWLGANPIGVAFGGFGIAASGWNGAAVAPVNLGTTAARVTFSVFGHQA